jgi:hypothetical protein
VVFVPIGGTVMKPYERRRAGDLAGTVGSRPPSWPVRHPSAEPEAAGRVGLQTPFIRTGEPLVLPEAERYVGTTATDVPVPVPTPTIGLAELAATNAATSVATVPPPTRNSGLSVVFAGDRWYSNGPAVSFTADRFVPAGDYFGFPVYREVKGDADTIFVAVVSDGPIAPYSRR